MTDDAERPRFARRPRTSRAAAVGRFTRDNFLESLDAIETFLAHATVGGRDAFTRNSPAYASGSMAVIRSAALLEVGEFAPYFADLPDEVAHALRTLRNIASHSGYSSMDDDVFWETLLRDLPPYLGAWRAAAEPSS